MRRRDFLKAGGVGILAFALRTVPAKGVEGRSGAVKLVLYRTDGELPGPRSDREPVGWAIVNSNAENEMTVLVNLTDGAKNAEYEVYVEIDGEPHPDGVGILRTHGNGKGITRLALDVSEVPSSSSEVDVQIVGTGETSFASPLAVVALKRSKKKAKKKVAKKKAKKKVAKKKAKKKVAKKKVAKKKAKKKVAKKKVAKKKVAKKKAKKKVAKKKVAKKKVAK